MSLPSPDLDTRSFQSIVDDVKRQIGLRCPEWTDHNVSDPGVTLIELFASMTEMALFRMNQVPEKNYIKFLEMLGISLEMPEPARTDLRFLLSRFIDDSVEGESRELTIPTGEVAATLRTETEDAIEFTTEADLHLVRPKMQAMLAVAGRDNAPDEEQKKTRPFKVDEEAFRIFSDMPAFGDAFYVGFETDVSGNIVELVADCVTTAAVGLNASYPAQVWEVWNGVATRWDRLPVIEDSTFGFNRTGTVQLAMPWELRPRVLAGQSSYWVRVRYTTDAQDLPPRGIEEERPDRYESSPAVRGITARTIGGTVKASNCTVIRYENMGQSDGTPGQVFQLLYKPVLTLRPGEHLLVGPQGADYEEWEEWTAVEDFAESGADDRHFALDSLTGEVFLGPSILQPDGSRRQYGKIPEKGMVMVFSAYRVGGGTGGNVREGKVRVLKSAKPYIADVINPIIATGGRDRETLERAKMRTREIIRIRNRAVTAEDYEFLAGKGSSGVGRAHCIQPTTHPSRSRKPLVRPGTVRVLIIPQLSRALAMPRPADLGVPAATIKDVYAFLDERRLLTATLEVDEPDYVFLSTEISLVADPRADADMVANRVQEALFTYFHPLFGGPNGDGWPFRRSITLADVYAQVGSVRGVAFLLDAKLYTSKIQNREEGLLGAEQIQSNAEGIRLEEGEMVCSRSHRIRVVPMSAVGADEAGTKA